MEASTVSTKSYEDTIDSLEGLLSGERDFVANAANTAALLWRALPRLNWVGFYFATEGGDLKLGPFQGAPACTRIPHGRGVCGAAAKRRLSVIVGDVHAFPGHISCDDASRSEIVVPLMFGTRLLGVLDLDSPYLNRFDAIDQAGLERVGELYVRNCHWQF